VNKPYVFAGLGLLGVVAVIVATYGVPVTIKTPDPNYSEGCYTSGTTGDLVTDSTAGTAIIESSGRRVVVTWPGGWSGRSSWRGVEVINRRGQIAYRTGTHVNLMGGYSYVDGSFLVCGLEPIS
jgi:hypothetical protein